MSEIDLLENIYSQLIVNTGVLRQAVNQLVLLQGYFYIFLVISGLLLAWTLIYRVFNRFI